MKLRAVSGIMLTLFVLSMLTLAFNIQSVKASSPTEVLDQQQTDISRSVPTKNKAQSFKPKLPILTRVDLYLQMPATVYEVTLYVKDGLRGGRTLGSASLPFPEDFCGWAEFIFDSPLSLVPEDTYFLVIGGDTGFPTWFASTQDLYPRGEAYVGGMLVEWQSYPGWAEDFAFKTYGFSLVLTIRTSGVSSHSPVTVTLNGKSVGTADDVNPLEIVLGYTQYMLGINSTRVWSIDPTSWYLFTGWTGPATGTSTSNPITIMLSADSSCTAHYNTQHSTNISFSNAFKDNAGNNLYTPPSSFKITFPNGTVSDFLDPNSSYYIPNGTTTWNSITWQGTEVTPSSSFDSANGNPTVNCKIYSLTVNPVFYDITGTAIIQPSSWTIEFPNGTTRTVSSPVTYNQAQTGNYLIVSIIWKGTNLINLAVTPFEEQVSMTSNSTVSELAFNSTSRELSFTVTGPSGTTGYVNLYIAKTFVENIADVKVYMDGDQLEEYSVTDYTAPSLDDSWLLQFTYLHRTHTIAVSLGPAPEVIPNITLTTSLTSDMVWSPSINCILPTSLFTSLSSSTSYFGFKIEINGNLTCNEVGLSETPILLSYSVTGGESWNDITFINTDSNGGYSAVWMPPATGNYLVKATWTGNATYPGTTTTINLAVIPFEEQNVFSVTSNSTVSALAFNSTSRELSFTVTGPSGTPGYVNVYIAKSLIDNIADVKVYLDGDQLNYTVTSLDDSWLLHFTYSHSAHKVNINLGLTPFIPPQLITPLSLSILALALTVATILLIFKIRKGTPPTILDDVFRKSKQAQIATTIGTKRHKTKSMQRI